MTQTTTIYEDAVQKQWRELREKAAMFDELVGILARRKNPVERGWLIELGESDVSLPLYFIGVNDTGRVSQSISVPTRVCFHEWG